MMTRIPTFAVIGRVNKGKSSIVSTLAEDDSVAIESGAGTTRECREYPVRVDGTTLLVLIDTPGFQQAPRALEWLREHEVSAANRRQVVEAFVRKFAGSGDFSDECKLLQPILNGAGILYVVDGARPFRRNYEAEMEILRWTGQPRMALINKIGDGDYVDDWRPALDQYFSIVRMFNAHRVTFTDRLALFSAFMELHEPWRDSLREAIRHLEHEWQRRERVAAHTIARLLVDQLTYSREIALARYEQVEDYKLKLEREFHDALRARERKARIEIEKLYQHTKLERDETELQKPIFDQDLFSKSTWSLLGLSPKQLVGLGAVTGATIGGMLDAAVGGASIMAGTIVGGALGAGSALFYSAQRLASIENIKKYMQGARILRIGPHQNRNFPWVVLDRALLHYFSVRNLAHSRRERLQLASDSEKTGIVTRLDSRERRRLEVIFQAIRKKSGGDATRLQDELEQELLRLIRNQ